MYNKSVLASIVLFITTSVMAQDAEIIAHRGSSALAPENTRAAFILAWQQLANGAECDIHLTKDQKIIISHDGSTKRTCGVEMEIKNTDANQLRKLDAGSLKNSKYKGEKMPFLNDVIRTVPPKRHLFIEVKCGTEILPFLKDAIDNSGKKERLVIIGFGLDVMKEAKKLMPYMPVYWLVGPTQDEKTKQYIPYDPNLIAMAKAAGIDGLDVHYGSLTKSFVDQAAKAGQKVYVWTVDDVTEAKRLNDIGVAGITTNKPDVLLKALKTHKLAKS